MGRIMIESVLHGDMQRGSWEACPRLRNKVIKSNSEMPKLLKSLDISKQFCDAKDAVAQGVGKGENFHWNVYSDVETQGTKLVETNVMPETNFTITQGTLTIDEFGNSVPYTGKLNDLSEQPVKEIIRKVMVNDAKKAIDVEAHNQFKLCPLRVAATATAAITLTTNGTATVTNSIALGTSHVKLIVDSMKERNIPQQFQGALAA